jgi:hypothetical protein
MRTKLQLCLPSEVLSTKEGGAELDKFLNRFLIFHVFLSFEIICDYF